MPGNIFEEEKGYIIKNFFIKDNISFEKYRQNSKWEENILSLYQNSKDLLLCTPTYRKYFSDSLERKLNNEDLGHSNNWFYLAYPDVAKWAEENYEEIKHSLQMQGVRLTPYFPVNAQNLGYIATMYQKRIYKRLECQV